jgi:hypothetical protein
LKTISDINETVDKFSEKKIADTVMTLVKTNTELGNLKTDFIDLTSKSDGRLFFIQEMVIKVCLLFTFNCVSNYTQRVSRS